MSLLQWFGFAAEPLGRRRDALSRDGFLCRRGGADLSAQQVPHRSELAVYARRSATLMMIPMNLIFTVHFFGVPREAS